MTKKEYAVVESRLLAIQKKANTLCIDCNEAVKTELANMLISRLIDGIPCKVGDNGIEVYLTDWVAMFVVHLEIFNSVTNNNLSEKSIVDTFDDTSFKIKIFAGGKQAIYTAIGVDTANKMIKKYYGLRDMMTSLTMDARAALQSWKGYYPSDSKVGLSYLSEEINRIYKRYKGQLTPSLAKVLIDGLLKSYSVPQILPRWNY